MLFPHSQFSTAIDQLLPFPVYYLYDDCSSLRHPPLHSEPHQKSGFTPDQAETLAYEQVNLLNSNLATTQDIESLRLATSQDFATHRSANSQDLETHRLSLESKLEEHRSANSHDLETHRLSLEAKLEEHRITTAKEIADLCLAQDAKIDALRLSLEAKLQSAKYDIIKWIYPGFVAMGGLIIAILKLFD